MLWMRRSDVDGYRQRLFFFERKEVDQEKKKKKGKEHFFFFLFLNMGKCVVDN